MSPFQLRRPSVLKHFTLKSYPMRKISGQQLIHFSSSDHKIVTQYDQFNIKV